MLCETDTVIASLAFLKSRYQTKEQLGVSEILLKPLFILYGRCKLNIHELVPVEYIYTYIERAVN